MRQPDPHSQIFEEERRRLAGLAYRMTGSEAETEDILQEAVLKFRVAELSRIDRPSQWLSTVVMRLCLDHLRSARARRETYVGAWLPDPLIADDLPPAKSLIVM
jgi:RNA polymerase sigma-70 factor (ECF subfamily)